MESGSKYENLIEDIYLNSGCVGEKTLKEISEMSEKDFDQFYEDNQIIIYVYILVVILMYRYYFLKEIKKIQNSLKRI